jgi:amino-acid N-acetyltransferase
MVEKPNRPGAGPAAEGTSWAAAVTGDRGMIEGLLRSCDLLTDDLPADLANFLVVKHGADLLATGGLELFGDVALLRSLAVVPAWRGRGLARELWRRLREQALAAGVEEIVLLTTTAETVFAGWGFRRVPRDSAPPAVRNTRQFAALCPDSAAFMRLVLP